MLATPLQPQGDMRIEGVSLSRPVGCRRSISSCEMVDSNTKVGSKIVASGMKPYLENYYDKTHNYSDQGKSLELLTALEIGDELRHRPEHPVHPLEEDMLKRRPHTAAPSLGDRPRSHCALTPSKSYTFNPYETSYTVHYPTRPQTTARATRPSSALNAFGPPSRVCRPAGPTTYVSEFADKVPSTRTQPIRSGSASGCRNNNPHPNKEFLVWRFPRSRGPSTPCLTPEIHSLSLHRPVTAPASESNRSEVFPAENMSTGSARKQEETKSVPEITDDIFDRVIRGKLKSTYQMDFAGIQQSATPPVSGRSGSFYADGGPVLEDPREKAKYSRDSTSRFVYGVPQNLPRELNVPVVRYGANRKKQYAAYGILPGVINSATTHVVTRTTYDCDVNERANKLYGMCKDVRSLGNQYGADALRKAMQNSTGEERETLQRILYELDRLDEKKSQPLSERRVAEMRCTSQAKYTPSCTSK